MREDSPAPATGQARNGFATSTATALMINGGRPNYLNATETGTTWCSRCWRPRVDPDDQDALTEAREAGIVVCCCDRDDTGGSN
jgi:hypothetical protein